MLSDHYLSCLSVILMYCGQTVRCILIPLGIKLGLSPGDIALDGDPAPPPKKTNNTHCSPPLFRPCLLRSNGWMDQNATWYGQAADFALTTAELFCEIINVI